MGNLEYRRNRAEMAGKWRLQSTLPEEVDVRKPNMEIWNQAAAQSAANSPLSMVQSGLDAFGQIAKVAGPMLQGKTLEPAPAMPKTTDAEPGKNIMPGEWDWSKQTPPVPMKGQPEQMYQSGSKADLISKGGGLLRDILTVAKARKSFGEEDAAFRRDALERTGEAALGIGEQARNWYDYLGTQLAGGISHPELRQDFVRYASGRAQTAQDALSGHESAQADSLRQDALAHAPALAAYNAARLYDDPEQVERELDDANWVVRVLGPEDPGERDAMLRGVAQRVFGRAIEARAQEPNPDPTGARQLMERWRGSLDDDEAARLEGVFSSVERGQRRGAAWDELFPQVGHDTDMAALRGLFGDPEFIGRHGLDEDDASHLSGRLDVAHAAAARKYAREQADGLSRETDEFWNTAAEDPVAAYDRLQTSSYLPQERKDFLRQVLLDPEWDGTPREYAPPPAATPPALPDGAGPRHPGRDPNVMTMEYRPNRDGLPEENRAPLPYYPGRDDARPVLLAANRTTADDAQAPGVQTQGAPREPAEIEATPPATPDAIAPSAPRQAGDDASPSSGEPGVRTENAPQDDDADQDGDISPAGRYALMRIAAGATPEEIEKEMGGLEEPSPLLDPVNVAVDVATGGVGPVARQGVRLMAKGARLGAPEAIKEGAKLIGKSVADDVGAGLAASGIGSAVEAAGGGKVMQEVAGIIGPHAASALGQASRKTTAQFLKDLKKVNEPAFDRLTAATKGSGRFGDNLRQINEETHQLGKAYDHVKANPIGPVDDPLVAIKPDEINNVIMSRGPAVMKDGQVIVQGKDLKKATGSSDGYGMVKFIWKHGEHGTDAEKITKNDIINFPTIARQYEPVVDERSKRKVWSIVKNDGTQINYVTSPLDEKNNLGVSIYISNDNRWFKLSKKR